MTSQLRKKKANKTYYENKTKKNAHILMKLVMLSLWHIDRFMRGYIELNMIILGSQVWSYFNSLRKRSFLFSWCFQITCFPHHLSYNNSLHSPKMQTSLPRENLCTWPSTSSFFPKRVIATFTEQAFVYLCDSSSPVAMTPTIKV